MTGIERSWKVGELARATGLTIRALHHYDEIGLLVPARTESGHRVYAAEDVERLYRILALRGVGMALDDIAAALAGDGASLVDTVRRHVAAVELDIERRQRLLGRLREMLDALERSPAPPVDELLGAVEAMTVVEATIEDVVTREPWEAMWELTAPTVVLLREAGGERVLPIWIGEPEAATLVMQRRGAKVPRPMGPDLTVALVAAADARIERILVERLEGNTFFATVTVTAAGEPREVDARPSDALNIAARTGVPIHVAGDLFDAAGLTTGWHPHFDPRELEETPPPWSPLPAGRPTPRSPRYVVDEESPVVLRRAAAEARALGHGILMLPHLLLGILADPEDAAAQLLARHGLDVAGARDAVGAIVAGAQRVPKADAPRVLGPRAVFAMHRAGTEARARSASCVEPMHVLLALIDSPDVHNVPGLDGLDTDVVRSEVVVALGD